MKSEKCECDRGSVEYYLVITTKEGETLDKIGYCKQCMKEPPMRRALDAVGLKP